MKNSLFFTLLKWVFPVILITGLTPTPSFGYCTSEAGSPWDSKIGKVTLNTINNTAPQGCATYTDYTHLSTVLTQEATYEISVTQSTCDDFYQAWIKVWIDFNQNGVFDPGEEVFSFGPTSGLNTYSGNFTVPSNALTGSTRMRVILSEDQISSPCDMYWYGETQDYTVVIETGQPCTDPPLAGTVQSTRNTVCSEESFTLSLTGNTSGTGQTYQWQSSINGVNWTNITGAELQVLTTSQTENLWYRAELTCGSTVMTDPIHITMKQSTECYCESAPMDEWDSRIDNVTLNTINNTAPQGCATYTDYTHLSTELTQETTYQISVKQGSCGSFYEAWGKVWIDFNQNGVFDPGEEVFSFGPTTGLNTYSGNFTVPSNALTGSTRMRVMLSEDPISNACETYWYGETQDYTVIIETGQQCTNPPQPGTVQSTRNTVCSEESFTLSLSGNTTGSGQTYQWQSSTNGVNWTNITGADLQFYTTTQTENLWYRAELTCGSSVVTDPIQITMKQSTECYCESASMYEWDPNISNVTLNTINNTAPQGCASYTDYTHLTTELTQEATYEISVTQGACEEFIVAWGKVWIDFNQNGIFDPGEEVLSFGPTTGLNTYSGNFTVPSNAVPGSTRMRVIISEDQISSPCGIYWLGETQDYTVIIESGQQCTDPPQPGTVQSTHNEVCSEERFTLSLSGHSTGPGQTYQWQSSNDADIWTNIIGAEDEAYTTTQNENLWYRAEITCGSVVHTDPVQINMKPLNKCYCDSRAEYEEDSKIDNVTLNTINNSSSEGCRTYTDYTDISTTLNREATYEISVTHGTCDEFFEAWGKVYIDYNQDGIFDAEEEVFSFGPTIDLETYSGEFTVPASALEGTTRMRVILSEDPISGPCEIYEFGETQDYSVNIKGFVNLSSMEMHKAVFEVYPNPANDRVNISVRYPESTAYQVNVFDMKGRKLYAHNGRVEGKTMHTIDTAEWPSGHYLIQLTIEDDKITEKLIIR